MQALVHLIQNKKGGHESLLNKLASKYTKPLKTAAEDEEPGQLKNKRIKKIT